MICSNCGNVVADGSVSCGYCGAAVDPMSQAFAQPGAYDGSQQWAVGADAGYGAQPPTGYAGQPEQGYGVGYGQPQAGYDQTQAGYGAQPPAGYDAQQQVNYHTQQAQHQYAAAQPGTYPEQPYAGMPAQLDGGGMPAQAYSAAPPPQTAKKNKTPMIIGIVAAAVLVLAIIGVGGFFLVQNLTAGAPDPITTPDPDPVPTPQPSPNPDPEPTSDPPAGPNTGNKIDPKTLLADFENPYVILDEAEIKITIDIGSGERDDSKYSYKVRCVVENKTDEQFRIMVTNASGNNYTGRASSVLFMKGYIPDNKAHNSSSYFQPGANLGYFDISRDDIGGIITDFKATISLSDVESLDVIVEYKITVPEM